MKKKILFLVPVLAVLLSVSNVHADTLVAGSTFGITYNGTSNFPTGYYLQPNTYYSHTIYLYNYELLSRPYVYLNVLLCSNGNIDMWVSNGGYSNYFDNNEYQLYDTGKICTFNGFNGTLKYFQLKVGKYEDLDGTGYEGVASSDINLYPYNEVFYEVRNFYLSNDNTLSEYLLNEALIDSNYDNTQDIINNNNQNTGIIVDKFDDMLNADSDPSVNPDDSKYDDYGTAEGDLKDKVNQADLSNLSIGIDARSSSWVWDTLTNLIQANSIVFGMFIAILSIGVIKLALGR